MRLNEFQRVSFCPGKKLFFLNESAMISKIDEDYEFELKDYPDDYDYNMVIEPEVVKTFQVKLKITGVTEFDPEIFLEDLD